MCLPLANTAFAPCQSPCSFCANLWTDEKVYSANGSLSTPTTTPYLRNGTQEPHFATLDGLLSLSGSASDDIPGPAAKEQEVWVTPQDLVLCGRGDPESIQARKKHERDVRSRYVRAEQEIASLSRGALHSTVSTTRRKRGAKTNRLAEIVENAVCGGDMYTVVAGPISSDR